MRRLMVILFVMVGGLVGGLMPAAAQERVVDPPKLAPLHSFRVGVLLAFNDRPLGVCQEEHESRHRRHGVCHNLVAITEQPVPAIPILEAGIVEFIEYDGISYERHNDETTWTASPIEGYDPNQTFIECCFTWYPPSVITRMGAVTLDGVQTTHYQWWTTDAEFNAAHHGQVVYDQFVTADGRVVADQTHFRGTFPGLGTGQLSLRWGYKDINTSIDVSPPPADRIQATNTSTFERWRGSRLLRPQLHGSK